SASQGQHSTRRAIVPFPIAGRGCIEGACQAVTSSVPAILSTSSPTATGAQPAVPAAASRPQKKRRKASEDFPNGKLHATAPSPRADAESAVLDESAALAESGAVRRQARSLVMGYLRRSPTRMR